MDDMIGAGMILPIEQARADLERIMVELRDIALDKAEMNNIKIEAAKTYLEYFKIRNS